MTEWQGADKVAWYRSRADAIPHRDEGEGVLMEVVPERVERVLDLGCGDGRLLALVRSVHPEATGVAIDFSRSCSRRRAIASTAPAWTSSSTT